MLLLTDGTRAAVTDRSSSFPTVTNSFHWFIFFEKLLSWICSWLLFIVNIIIVFIIAIAITAICITIRFIKVYYLFFNFVAFTLFSENR